MPVIDWKQIIYPVMILSGAMLLKWRKFAFTRLRLLMRISDVDNAIRLVAGMSEIKNREI